MCCVTGSGFLWQISKDTICGWQKKIKKLFCQEQYKMFFTNAHSHGSLNIYCCLFCKKSNLLLALEHRSLTVFKMAASMYTYSYFR